MDFMRLKAWLARRMPTVQQTAAVYGVIVLAVYGWTLYWFAWKLPSWLYFLTLGEILVSLAYSMVVNFIESLIVLFVLISISVLLPAGWFRDKFAGLGSSLVVLSLSALAYYLGTIIALQDFPPSLARSALLVVAGILVLLYLIGKINLLLRAMEEIANRSVIFLYVFLPLSAISFLVVLVRNIIEAFNV
ncbi:MAG: hypothetical protein C4583_02370 [Anaerolineaceae bacterium]|nr:MAG: hypothetical protein C4583_02370 [Anaerolineaceae bacterium]